MPNFDHSTKITIGLAITMATLIFNVGFFYAKQEALSTRVAQLESDRQKTVQMSEDIAVIKGKVATMDGNLQSVLARISYSTK